MRTFAQQYEKESRAVKKSDRQMTIGTHLPVAFLAVKPENFTAIQRKADCACGGGCPGCQAKNSNLPISQPNDASEKEADVIADKVMRMPTHSVENEKVQLKPISFSQLQRKCVACDDEEKIQRKESGNDDGGMVAPPFIQCKADEMPPVTAKDMHKKYLTACADVSILQRLSREEPITTDGKIKRLKMTKKIIEKYFDNLRPQIDNEPNPLRKEALRSALRCIIDCTFGNGYAMSDKESEMKRMDCRIMEAEWEKQTLEETGNLPNDRLLKRKYKLVPAVPDPKVCWDTCLAKLSQI